MADNLTTTTTVSTVPSGSVIATDDVAGVHFQKVKIDIGGDGASTVLANANPLPVQIGDGTRQATVRDTGTSDSLNVSIVDASGNQITSFGGSGGTSHGDDAAFTIGGASSITPMGALADETTPDSVDEGDVGVPRMTLDRKLLTRIVGATDANRLDVDGSGHAQVDIAAVSTTLTVDSELPAAAALADNAANPTAPAVGAFGLVWDGATWDRAAGNSTDGALVNLGANNDVTITSGSVTADTELPAAAALGDNASNPTAPAVGSFGMVFDGTTWDRQKGDSTDGTLVNLGANNDVTVTSGTITANQGSAGAAWEVVGDVAHDATAPINPVVIGAQMETMADSAPGTRAGTDTDAVKIASTDGAIFVIPTGPQTWSYHENSSSALTDASVHAAPGAGLSLYVTDIIFSTGAATACNIFFEEGASTVLGPYYLEAVAGRGVALHFGTPKKITANTALTVTTSAAIAHGVDVLGFIAPG